MKHTVHNGSRPNGTVYTKIKEEFFYIVQMSMGFKQKMELHVKAQKYQKLREESKSRIE